VEVTEAPADPAKNLPNGEVRDVRLFRNGLLIKIWHGQNIAELVKAGCQAKPAQRGEGRKVICETEVNLADNENRLAGYAFNRDNGKSNDAEITVNYEGTTLGQLYILTIGVDEYANPVHNLKYAVADSAQIAKSLGEEQETIEYLDGGYLRTEILTLTNEMATKENILNALKFLARREGKEGEEEEKEEVEDLPVPPTPEFYQVEPLRPQDALIIHFSGHGTAADNHFYLIPHDGFPTENSLNPKEKLQKTLAQSISDLELQAGLEKIDAGKIILIIDACNSGQALEAEEKRRGPMNSRGLAQLAYEKGIYVLAASQSFQAALEVEKLGHGLLTYSLLEGLEKADAKKRGVLSDVITDRNWLDYAVQKVPQLQLEAMTKRYAEVTQTGRGSEIIVLEGDNKNLPPEKRGLQTPRVFYGNQFINSPFFVASRPRQN
jgi:uncharacterized caspase-like protein